MTMRTIAAVFAAAWLTVAGPASAQALTQPPGWVLDWSDEFDGPVLDRTKWVPETGGNGWGNDELEFYTARPENVRVDGGNLVIDRVGIWELDSIGSGIVQAYSISGNVLHAYAPIEMVPHQANGNPGSIHRFGHRIDVGGGIDCDESGPFGTYRWSVSGGQLTLTAVREPCGQRRAVYEGTWARVH